MANVICDTSPLQYLYQLGQIELLPQLCSNLIVPQAVVNELGIGQAAGVFLPDPNELPWLTALRPVSEKALPLITDLGPGESEVLMLGLELPDSVLILDDALARRIAEALGLKMTGTLGILLDGKRAGLIPQVRPLLEQLQTLRFRIAPETFRAVLQLAGE